MGTRTVTIVVLATLALFSACADTANPGAMGQGATDNTGCGTAAHVPETKAAPYSVHHGYPVEPVAVDPPNPSVLAQEHFASEIDGLPAFGTITFDNSHVVAYYGAGIDRADADMVLARGGLILQELHNGRTWNAGERAEQIPGEGVTQVRVGSYDGVLNPATTMPDGTRPHYLSWGRGHRE